MRVPVRFRTLGSHRAPTVDVVAKIAGHPARLKESALVDTGSSLTLFPRRLLQLNRFPLGNLRRAATAVRGIGGPAELWYLQDAILAVYDSSGAIHPFNLERLFVTDAEFPPILGRGTLRQMSARLEIDFAHEKGELHLG